MKGWAKTTRICVMMALDTAFLAVELGVGYYVSSLALIADGFHMLNDIISLAVGLWAVNLAQKESNDRFSYGWLRAEILGAFFNATFLIGLCVTIVLEAIQRFFDPPNISNPQIVLIVGCFGLASNLVGFWVLGGHGHSHGGADEEAGHDHDHEHEHEHEHVHASPEVYVEPYDNPELCPDEEEIEEEIAADNAIQTDGPTDQSKRAPSPDAPRHIVFHAPTTTAPTTSHTRSVSRGSARRRANSGRRVPTSIEEISIHPSSFRQDIQEIIAARRNREAQDLGDSDSVTTDEHTPAEAATATERTPLIQKVQFNGIAKNDDGHNDHDGHNHGNGNGHSHSHSHSHDHDHEDPAGHAHNANHTGHAHHHRTRRDSHGGHHHSAPKTAGSGGHGGHGHSHGDMGMNAMVLHVMGDALGNIGVIVTALIIWKTNWAYRMYADPIVSLLITVIILRTAIPLTKATSKILLQATPDHIDINDIREDIQDLEGVLSCHHIHVWQLSDSQIVASMHIEVAFPISEYGGEKYMNLAKRVRKCLHGYGIHSATIQPEFRVDGHGHGHGYSTQSGPNSNAGDDDRGRAFSLQDGATEETLAVTTASHTAADTSATAASSPTTTAQPFCLLDCVDNCVGQGCCSKASRTGSPPSSQHSDHDGHSH